ncbi:MAG: hypothetical protein LBR09_00035 [Endomicrobium sp.]|nr:hypothetical protein [Endomicrobium sp.]
MGFGIGGLSGNTGKTALMGETHAARHRSPKSDKVKNIYGEPAPTGREINL